MAQTGKSTGSRSASRDRRHSRVRKHVEGTSNRPRLAVFRSARHVVAQVIDDSVGRTLASASTMEEGLRADAGDKSAKARKAVHKEDPDEELPRPDQRRSLYRPRTKPESIARAGDSASRADQTG